MNSSGVLSSPDVIRANTSLESRSFIDGLPFGLPDRPFFHRCAMRLFRDDKHHPSSGSMAAIIVLTQALMPVL